MSWRSKSWLTPAKEATLRSSWPCPTHGSSACSAAKVRSGDVRLNSLDHTHTRAHMCPAEVAASTAKHTHLLSVLLSDAGRPPPADANLAADQWPPGCLGFAVNLVRPAMPNTRHNLMYSQVRWQQAVPHQTRTASVAAAWRGNTAAAGQTATMPAAGSPQLVLGWRSAHTKAPAARDVSCGADRPHAGV